MGYLTKIIEIENDLDNLRIYPNELRYIDRKGRLSEIDSLISRVCSVSAPDCYKSSLLSRLSQCKSTIADYGKSKSKSGGDIWTVLSFISGAALAIAGFRIKSQYEKYLKRMSERVIDQVLEKTEK